MHDPDKTTPITRRKYAMAPLIALLALFLSSFPCRAGDSPRIEYPAARRDQVIDEYHGVKVPDPYRWLENSDSDSSKRWVEQQNELSSRFINSNPDFLKLKKRMRLLWNYPKYSVPRRKGGRYFFYGNTGLQNQSVLFMQKTPEETPTVVLDPNTWSAGGTRSLGTVAITEDGALMAYGVQTSGSDWQELRIRDINSGRECRETLKRCRFCSIAWARDNSGFFYDRYPDEGSVPKEDEIRYNKVYWHALNTPQSEDVLVLEDPGDKELSFIPAMTEDGKYLILRVVKGTDPFNRIYYKEMGSQGGFIHLIDRADARYDFIENAGSTFYFETDLGAPRGRVISVDLGSPERENWHEIIPQGEDAIDFCCMVNDQFMVCYSHNACALLKQFNRDGKPVRTVSLPGIGSIGGMSGRRTDRELFFSYTSWLFPNTIYRYDFTHEEPSIFRASSLKFDPSLYRTEQVFYTSRDGATIPMFIIHRRGVAMNGKNPTILNGYGGFSVNMNPYFSVPAVIWLEQGGIYAVANIRGGGEFGEEWHRAGMREKKQNVFDDFIGAAEWLVGHRYTCPEKLAIDGASNGGLLVAACMVQRPSLFGAVICEVPLTDMLRYNKFTVGYFWETEYGDAGRNPADFAYLYAYSPYHHIKEGATYPACLVLTADHDDRVVAAHAKKFVAALQANDSGKNPILLKVETDAGHGGGKPTAKIIEERSEVFAFLFQVFGMRFK